MCQQNEWQYWREGETNLSDRPYVAVNENKAKQVDVFIIVNRRITISKLCERQQLNLAITCH